MNAHAMKTRHVGYRCSCVIHNFSSNQGIKRSVSLASTQVPTLPSSLMSQATKGCYDAARSLPVLAMTTQAVDVLGERIDAETCDGFETGED